MWEFDPEKATYKQLTKGRSSKTTYRIVSLDSEKRFIDTSENILMSTFNENSKNSGYYEYHYRKNNGQKLVNGPFRYSNPRKARLSNKVIFTRQSFEEFPNIRVSDLSFKSQ